MAASPSREVVPLSWSAHADPAGGSLVYRSRTHGFEIRFRPDDTAFPGRPWSLLRGGQSIERCHTLRIAKRAADRVLAEGGS